MGERLYPHSYQHNADPPNITINHGTMLDLFQWFTTRALVIQPAIPADPGGGILAQAERMQLDWFIIGDEPFQAMQAVARQLSGLKRNIAFAKGGAHALRLLSAQELRFS